MEPNSYNHDNFPPGEGTIDGYANIREPAEWERDLIEEEINHYQLHNNGNTPVGYPSE